LVSQQARCSQQQCDHTTQSSAEMAEPSSPYATKSGWLTKQGHIFRTWKKRWFVLEEQLLKYYKAADESTSTANPEKMGDSDMKGCISIQNCKVVTLPPADAAGRSFCFQLTPVSGKIFLICAPDDEAREQWMAAIQVNAEPRAGGPQVPLGEPSVLEPQPEDVGNVIGKEMVTLADFELLKVIGR